MVARLTNHVWAVEHILDHGLYKASQLTPLRSQPDSVKAEHVATLRGVSPHTLLEVVAR
jgi:hypothetical protein